MTLVLRRVTAVAILLLAGGLLGGCAGKQLPVLPVGNFLPVVRLTAAPIDTNAVCKPDPARSCYSLTLDWVGFDPDGRVDHFVYAVDPPDNADTTWIVTRDQEKRLVFSSSSSSPRADSMTILRGFHVFVIAAVDNDGATGPRAYRAFFSFTKAPTVTIDNPRPITSAVRTMPPSIRISWHGTDEDGVFTTKPVRYKYLLLGPGNENSVVPGGIDAIFASQGIAIRRYCAPEFRASQGWTSVGGDTTSVQFTDLLPGATYLFTIVALDEAGAYSPVFLFDTNILRFKVGFAAAFGPRLTVFNESFFFEFPATFNPSIEVRIELPAGQPVTFYWFGTPPVGAEIVAYRWMLDGDVYDEHPRTVDATDLRHWSSPSASVISATLGPFAGGDHFFYVEASDNTGFRSLATVHFFVVVPTFSRPLLVVDDTRYEGDGYLGNGTRVNYGRGWPAAAELDTFMYAVGNVPWRGYPEGTTSAPGVFHGYDFDTIGTRKGIADLGTSLATLGGYQHVIWLVDFQSATFGNPGNVPIDPMTSLRFMSTPGHLNSLAAFVRMGGDAWLVGGGGAYATLILNDDSGNNQGGGSYVWNHVNPGKRELDAGRFMYDVAKWQSVIRDRTGIGNADHDNIVRSLGRFRFQPGVYAAVPAAFDRRKSGQDPLPPGRTGPGYYPTAYAAEFINDDNIVLEPVSGEPLDFKIDAFDDPTPAPMIARWPSSDSLNTTVEQADVTQPGTSRAAGKAMRIRTRGGGASTGDFVTHEFLGNLRDWSGLNFLRLELKQDQPASLVQWRVRAIDARGASASALVTPGIAGQFASIDVPATAFAPDPGSRYQPDFVQIRRLQFELARGDAAAVTDFDRIEVITLPEGAVLDTLMAAKVLFTADAPISATMTVYHGHDFPKPFIFTGFAPWNFRLTQCQQLFDFVLQKLWGLQKSPGTFAARRGGPTAAANAAPRSRTPSPGATPAGAGGSPHDGGR